MLANSRRLFGGVSSGVKLIYTQMNRVSTITTEPKAASLSIDEALFLAQVNGVSTVKELQQQIMTAPSFSPNKSPFLIENFYDTLENTDPEDPLDIAPEMDDISRYHQESKDEFSATSASGDATIHQLLKQTFNPANISTFSHSAPGKPKREFLTTANGYGTRRRAYANVTITRGTGKIYFTRKGKFTGTLENHLPLRLHMYARMDLIQPFFETGTCGLFDVTIDARGGGPVGQALAARLAIARALLKACPDVLGDLAKDDMLAEDLRQDMPKMTGRYTARSQRAWTKR